MSSGKKFWEIEGEELEEHLASDCELTIIEPMQTTEYYTPQERELMAQFPKDQPEPPEYDEVLTKPLESKTAEEDLLYDCAAHRYTAIGEPFKTARYWCLRVKYVG